MSTRILVIDDDPAVLGMYQEILELEGYDCIPYTTPLLGVDEVVQLAPRMIIMDWLIGAAGLTANSLPSMELINRLRRAPATAHIPLLVCSAGGSLLHVYDDWFVAQRIVVVDKPFDMDVLLDRIIALIGTASTNDHPSLQGYVEPLAQPPNALGCR